MSGSLWDAVSTVLDAAERGAKYAPLAEGELVQAAVDFANGTTFRGFLMLLGGLDLGSRPLLKSEGEKLFDRVAAEEFEPQRAPLVEDLDSIAAGSPPEEIAERAKQAASRMVLVPHYDFTGGALRVTHRYIAEDLEARLAYVTLLFLDGSRDYGNRLCRCKLDGCGVFFWEQRDPRGGQPRRLYCSREHLEQFHAARGVERVRKYREKKRRTKRKGKAK